MTSQPPRNNEYSSADPLNGVGFGHEVCRTDQVISDSDIVPLQFFRTGDGAAIGAFELDYGHGVFLNPNFSENSEIFSERQNASCDG